MESVQESNSTTSASATPTMVQESTIATPPAAPTMVSESEAALYDRQIRLWGLAAQNRIRQSKVAIYGMSGGFSSELIKNLVLAGIGTLYLYDNEMIQETDLSSGFFFRPQDVSKSKCSSPILQRIQQLNPLVDIQVISKPLDGLQKQLDALVVTTLPTHQEINPILWNQYCRTHHIKFYYGQSIGLGGFLFSDQIDLVYSIVKKSNNSQEQQQTFRYKQSFNCLDQIVSCPFPKSSKKTKIPIEVVAWILYLFKQPITRDELFLKAGQWGISLKQEKEIDFWIQQFEKATSLESDFAPTAAILGGILSQDLLNSLAARELPIVNFLSLDINGSGAANVYQLGNGLDLELIDSTN